MAFGLQLHGLRIVVCHVGGRPSVATILGGLELGAERVAGKGQSTSRMLFLDIAQKVGGERDLGLHLLLAVAEVIIGNDGDNHPRGRAAGQLEGPTIVVQLTGIAPAHAVLLLPPGCHVPGRQAKLPLGQLRELRCKHNASRMPGPVLDVQTGIILGQVGIAGIAKDRLDEIEIADQPACAKK